jgi:hypothetical protein
VTAPGIAQFVADRLTEWQTVAEAAGKECPPPWKAYPDMGIVEHSGPESTNPFHYERGDQLWDSEGCTESWRRLCMDETVAKHVALNDPAAVLRQVAALRLISGLHRPMNPEDVLPLIYPVKPVCNVCADWDGRDRDGAPPVSWPCPTFTTLAGMWAGHPDYDTTWEQA